MTCSITTSAIPCWSRVRLRQSTCLLRRLQLGLGAGHMQSEYEQAGLDSQLQQ